MNKVLLGLLLGALLGAIDGGTAWFTPSVRAQLAGIIVGSTIKGPKKHRRIHATRLLP